MTFYAVTAQVIPVLFLALVFQGRYADRIRVYGGGFVEASDETPDENLRQLVAPWSTWVVIVLLAMVVGEVVALASLASGADGPERRAVVLLSIAYGGVAVVGPPIGKQWRLIRLAIASGAQPLWFVLLTPVLLAIVTWQALAALTAWLQ